MHAALESQEFSALPSNRLGFRRLHGNLESSNRTFTTRLLRLLVGLTVNLFVLERALFAEFPSRFSFVLLTYEKMPIITRRIRTVSTKVVSARSWRSLPRRTPTSEKNFSRHFVSAVLEQERTIVLFSTFAFIVAEAVSTSLCTRSLFAFH